MFGVCVLWIITVTVSLCCFFFTLDVVKRHRIHSHTLKTGTTLLKGSLVLPFEQGAAMTSGLRRITGQTSCLRPCGQWICEIMWLQQDQETWQLFKQYNGALKYLHKTGVMFSLQQSQDTVKWKVQSLMHYRCSAPMQLLPYSHSNAAHCSEEWK